jgi:hypothetical protein
MAPTPEELWIASLGVVSLLSIALLFAEHWISPLIARIRKGKTPLEIIFDQANPSKRFWSIESPKDDNGNRKPGTFWEYRVAIKNNSSKTIKNISVTTEHTGRFLPIRPIDAIFDKTNTISYDLKPWCSELVPVIRWPIPKIQTGMLAGPSALQYGPVIVTVSADDVPPAVRTFRFDYQAEPKRGVVGTLHKMSRKYMPLYVAEFQFRYNNRENADIFGTAIKGC